MPKISTKLALIACSTAYAAVFTNADPRTWSTCPTSDPKTIQDVCRLCAISANPPLLWWVKKGEACAKH